MAFETTFELPGPPVVSRGDFARFDAPTFTHGFDGSSAGIDPALHLDAVLVPEPGFGPTIETRTVATGG